jgi:hypothetical protein
MALNRLRSAHRVTSSSHGATRPLRSAGAPQCGTNLLAARLRDLERDRLVARRKLPRPAASTVYGLTPLGRELEPIVMALGRWGRKLLAPVPGEEVFQGRYLLFALRANFVPERARGVSETYELRIGGDVVHARVEDGTLEVAEGRAEKPDLVVETSLEVLLAIARAETDPATEIRAGRLVRGGGPRALRRFWKIFDGAGLPTAGSEAA